MQLVSPTFKRTEDDPRKPDFIVTKAPEVETGGTWRMCSPIQQEMGLDKSQRLAKSHQGFRGPRDSVISATHAGTQRDTFFQSEDPDLSFPTLVLPGSFPQ